MNKIKSKILFSILTLLVSLLSKFVYCYSEPNADTNDFAAHFDEKIPLLMNEYGVPGMCIAVISNGKIVWKNAYGYADAETNIKMNLNTVYRVESISKSVTAWGVMKLVEKRVIDLDAPVLKYLKNWKLPESKYSVKNITVGMLLSHTAGMPLGTIGEEYPPNENPPALREYLSREALLASEPGEGFSYSNTGYNLLELMIEEVTGKDFAEYMKEKILIPLEMKNSSFVRNDSLFLLLPFGYDLNGNRVAPYVYPAKASGGLFATVEDIARFVLTGVSVDGVSQSKPLSGKSVSEIYTPRIGIPGIFGVVADSYGYGHFIETLSDGRQVVWHGGQGHGWMSHFHLVPEKGDGIVILTNSQRSWPVISQILSDWASKSGLGAVKMGRIRYGIIAMRAIITALFLSSFLFAIKLITEVRKGKRKFSPFSKFDLKRRLSALFTGIVIISILIWCAAQPYLIVSSIFPVLSGWAGYALLCLAVILIVSSTFTKKAIE